MAEKPNPVQKKVIYDLTKRNVGAEGPKRSTPVKKNNGSSMIKISGNATPSQIANIKAYARSLETRRKGAAADKMGAEGPKRSTSVKKTTKKK